VKLLGRKKDTDVTPAVSEDAGTPPADGGLSDTQPRTTAPKGRPTPKRDAGRRRGPVAPAPLTAAEARRRRKEMRGPKLSREERKVEKVQRRSQMSERRERMMAGEDAYLLPRDKGPVRRYVRDVVDARRNVLGLFMPAALALIFVMLSIPAPAVQQVVSYVMMGLVLGRKVNRLADEKFAGNTETGWKLGFYAASRASQLRRMRAPRPQVARGADVA
jgi:hypothetical protein